MSWVLSGLKIWAKRVDIMSASATGTLSANTLCLTVLLPRTIVSISGRTWNSVG